MTEQDTNPAERIRTAFERNQKALTLRPAIGRGTAVTRVRVRAGLTCDIEDGPWRLVADMSEKYGGLAEGPNPGVFGRTALGSCLAIGYMLWAAKRGVPIAALEVEVQADYDSSGNHGVNDVNPGYDRIRCIVRVESDAPEEDVLRILDEADSHSDYLAVFERPQEVHREVHITAPQS
jgi:uncharacterized OsmC-like protein